MLESMKLTTLSSKNRSGYLDLLNYVQTDAATPNIVCYANNAWSCCVRIGSRVQTDATTPNTVGTCGALWEGYNLYDFGDHVLCAWVVPTMPTMFEELCKRIQHCCAALR